MSDYWVDSPDNPFNRMDYTRGGGGNDNSDTEQSNRLRAFAMQGSGAGALPRFNSGTEAQKAADRGALPQFESIAAATVFARRYGVSGVVQAGGKTVTVGNPVKGPAKPTVSAPPSRPADTPKNANPRPLPNPTVKPGGSGAGTSNPRTVGVPTKPGSSLGGSGVGSPVVVTGPLKPSMQDTITEFQVGGVKWRPEPNTSNADQVEERLGEAEFLSPAWWVNWGIAAVDTVHNVNMARNEAGHQMMSTLEQFGSEVVKEWDRAAAMPTLYEAEDRRNPFMVATPPY